MEQVKNNELHDTCMKMSYENPCVYICQIKIISKRIAHAYYNYTEGNLKVPTENINNQGQILHP